MTVVPFVVTSPVVEAEAGAGDGASAPWESMKLPPEPLPPPPQPARAPVATNSMSAHLSRVFTPKTPVIQKKEKRNSRAPIRAQKKSTN
ncbi:hypothetical protein [Variovorax sp. KK3]|uniref:hypothetical protein n=1 Tax=Variovorax sp. KK3 TaxID=1855728 RepID=UPI00117BFE28|nr:hypothetical protein [Variovorax sp. KK3]